MEDLVIERLRRLILIGVFAIVLACSGLFAIRPLMEPEVNADPEALPAAERERLHREAERAMESIRTRMARLGPDGDVEAESD